MGHWYSSSIFHIVWIHEIVKDFHFWSSQVWIWPLCSIKYSTVFAISFIASLKSSGRMLIKCWWIRKFISTDPYIYTIDWLSFFSPYKTLNGLEPWHRTLQKITLYRSSSRALILRQSSGFSNPVDSSMDDILHKSNKMMIYKVVPCHTLYFYSFLELLDYSLPILKLSQGEWNVVYEVHQNDLVSSWVSNHISSVNAMVILNHSYWFYLSRFL